MGGLNGILFAILVGVVAAIWFSAPTLGIVIASAMVINMLVAGLAGTLIPLGLEHAGIDPAKKRYILIKSRQHFRAGFDAITERVVMVSGPGITTSDYEKFPWQKLRRPIHPLDLVNTNEL